MAIINKDGLSLDEDKYCYVILVEEKGTAKVRDFYVSDDGLITHNFERAYRCSIRNDWAVMALCSYWNVLEKMKGGPYIYSYKMVKSLNGEGEV